MSTKIWLKIKRSEKTKKRDIKIWSIGKLNKKVVKEKFIKKVTASVQNTQNKWKIQMKYQTKSTKERREKNRKEKKNYMKQLEK